MNLVPSNSSHQDTDCYSYRDSVQSDSEDEFFNLLNHQLYLLRFITKLKNETFLQGNYF